MTRITTIINQPPVINTVLTVGQGPSGVGGGGGSFSTANILYVDASGNNGTAVRNRPDLPYLTPLAAQAAASTGDTIVVRPGSYSGATLGGKAGINWFWEPGSSYTNTTTDADVWSLAAGVHNICGSGKFYQTVGNGGRVFFSPSTASGYFEANYAESRGGCLTANGSMIARVAHAKSVTYDVVLPSPHITSAIIDIEVGVVDAGSDAVACEGTVTSTVPISVRIGNIINCGGFVVNEESGAPQKANIWVGTTARPFENQVMQVVAGSSIILTLGEYRHPSTDITDLPPAANNRIIVLDRLTGEDIKAGTIAPARLGTGSGGSTKFLREDSTFQTIPGGGDALVANPLSQFAATTSAQLRGVISDETGSGLLYFQGGALGTPASATLTSCTGLPITTGVSGLAANVATFLATPSSANLRAALTDEVGAGAAYFVGGALGTPASVTLTNGTGLPISTGVSGLGTGVATVLAQTAGAGSGVATLVGGKLVTSQLPDIAIVDYLGSVASQVAMLALAGQKGDWAIRSDLGTVWVITGADPTLLAGWTQLSYPTAPVTTVAGRTGAVTLTSSDITDFAEALDDRVAALLVAGTGISLSYNDGANSLTVSTSGVVLTTTDQTIAGNKTFSGTTTVQKTIEGPSITYIFDDDFIEAVDLRIGPNIQFDISSSPYSSLEVVFTRTVAPANGRIAIVFAATSKDFVSWTTSGGTVRWLGVEPDWATYTNRRVTIDWTVIGTDIYLEVAKYTNERTFDIPIETITYGATMAVDALASNKKHITLAGNGTISNPTNAVDGRVLTFRLRQDGTGNRVPVWGSKYRFRGDLATVTLSTAAGRTDRVAFEYDVTDDVWACISFFKDS